MALDPSSVAAAMVIGKPIFQKFVGEIYDYVTKEAGQKLRFWNTKKKIDNLYWKIYDIRKVKTIWQIDKNVDLVSVYCDTHITWDDKRHKIERIDNFRSTENILIQGIAGQGKSIIFRYLCSAELNLTKYIPIFVELKRVNKNQSLMDKIFLTFKRWILI